MIYIYINMTYIYIYIIYPCGCWTHCVFLRFFFSRWLLIFCSSNPPLVQLLQEDPHHLMGDTAPAKCRRLAAAGNLWGWVMAPWYRAVNPKS